MWVFFFSVETSLHCSHSMVEKEKQKKKKTKRTGRRSFRTYSIKIQSSLGLPIDYVIMVQRFFFHQLFDLIRNFGYFITNSFFFFALLYQKKQRKGDAVVN